MPLETNKFLHDLACHPEKARAAILEDPTLLKRRCLWGESPLHFMAIERKIDAVKLLIELGADLNVPDEYGDTVLTSILRHDNPEMLQLLLISGADPNHHSEIWEWPIIDALERVDFQAMELLLRHGATAMPGEDFALEFKWKLDDLDEDTRAKALALLDQHWGVGTCDKLLALADEHDV